MSFIINLRYIVPKVYANEKAQAQFVAHVNIPKLKAELAMLQKRIEALNAPVVFGHCDLLSGNLIFDKERDEIFFIDYEYGMYTFRGFDIGNHFAEYAGK
jgi:ethanolamine kinase